jgi:hypothetical protein
LKSEPGKQSPLERSLRSSKYSEELYPETIELKRRNIELRADRLRNIRGELEGLHVQAEPNLTCNRAESPMGNAMGGLTNCTMMQWCR